MVNYANSKIYKITCNVTGLTYYGSTVNSLSKRMGQHRDHFKKGRGKSCNSKLVLAAGNYDYCLVEKCPCDDKTELHRRERFYIESNECVNKNIPGRTRKEWKFENKEKILEQTKVYRAAHGEDQKQYRAAHREDKKQYRAENKEEISEYHKQYRAKNKEKIKARNSIKVTCECGCSVTKGNIFTHKKTQKHINLMSQIEQSL